MMNVLIAEFAPQGEFCSQNIFLVGVALYHSSNVKVIDVHPCGITTIGNSEIISDSHINVKWSVLRDDDFILGIWHTSTPPLHNISFFNLNVS